MHQMKQYALLCDALQTQEMYIVEELLNQDCPVNLTDIRRENTPLHWACIHANIEIAQTLLDRYANVNATNDKGDIPLHSLFNTDKLEINSSNLQLVPNRSLMQQYISQKIIGIVKLLLESGTDINTKNDNGFTALHLAAQGDFHLIITYLIENGAEVNGLSTECWTPLHCAAMTDQLSTVQILLEHGADVTVRGNGNVSSPLCCAAIKGNAEIVEALLTDSQNNVDIVNNYDNRPILYAIESNNLKVAKLLIAANASVENLADSMHCALNRKFESLLVLLLESGADADCRDEDGATLLWNAVYQKYDDRFLMLLIEKGADIHAIKEDTGASILMAAVLGKNYSFARYLVLTGVSVRNSDVMGFTALHVIANRLASAQDDTFNVNQMKDTLVMLLQNGADVNAKTKCGRTPLSFHGPHKALEQELLKHMARFRFFGGLISKFNLRIIHTKERLKQFYQGCYNELASIKNKKFCKLLDETNVNRLSSYARNRSVRAIVESSDFDVEFPIYGADFKSLFTKGEERMMLMDDGEFSLNLAFKVELPWNVTRQIVTYLSCEDLMNLKRAFDPHHSVNDLL